MVSRMIHTSALIKLDNLSDAPNRTPCVLPRSSPVQTRASNHQARIEAPRFESD